MNPTSAEGQLSPEENQRIFAEDIVPAHLFGLTPRRRPVAVLVVGQTGAGKTAITALIRQTLGRNKQIAWINMDFYNPFHPKYAEWQAERPTEADRLVRADGERWWEQAQEFALSRHADILLESAAVSPAEFEDICRRIKAAEIPVGAAPYRIEAVFVAVPGAVSQFGILSRFIAEVARRGRGRLIPAEIHDASQRGVLRAASAFEAKGLGEFAVVMNRSAEAVFMTQIPSGGIANEADRKLVAAITQERQRQLRPTETHMFAAELAIAILRAPPEVLPELHRVTAAGIELMPGDPQDWHALIAYATSARTQHPRETHSPLMREMSDTDLSAHLATALANWSNTSYDFNRPRLSMPVALILDEITQRSLHRDDPTRGTAGSAHQGGSAYLLQSLQEGLSAAATPHARTTQPSNPPPLASSIDNLAGINTDTGLDDLPDTTELDAGTAL
ncbi:zeta toxin family protein [Nocardia sp. 004]|uniref:zeta toxin family protein n=1 Tax=Nocardia sp. 004 TaxID=3385978 RepID=UPI0039A37BB6